MLRYNELGYTVYYRTTRCIAYKSGCIVIQQFCPTCPSVCLHVHLSHRLALLPRHRYGNKSVPVCCPVYSILYYTVVCGLLQRLQSVPNAAARLIHKPTDLRSHHRQFNDFISLDNLCMYQTISVPLVAS